MGTVYDCSVRSILQRNGAPFDVIEMEKKNKSKVSEKLREKIIITIVTTTTVVVYNNHLIFFLL